MESLNNQNNTIRTTTIRTTTAANGDLPQAIRFEDGEDVDISIYNADEDTHVAVVKVKAGTYVIRIEDNDDFRSWWNYYLDDDFVLYDGLDVIPSVDVADEYGYVAWIFGPIYKEVFGYRPYYDADGQYIGDEERFHFRLYEPHTGARSADEAYIKMGIYSDYGDSLADTVESFIIGDDFLPCKGMDVLEDYLGDYGVWEWDGSNGHHLMPAMEIEDLPGIDDLYDLVCTDIPEEPEDEYSEEHEAWEAEWCDECGRPYKSYIREEE